MRNLDDFDLRPGDPGNPRRPSPPPSSQSVKRTSLGRGDVEAPAAASGPGQVARGVHDTDLRRHYGGEPAFDATEPDPRDAAPRADAPARRAADPSSPRSSSRVAGALIALVVAAVLVAAFWLVSRRVEPPPPGAASNEKPAPVAPETADDAGRPAELEAPLPPLDQSDALVRQLVGSLSRNPALARWLASSNLIRTFAAAVENTSLGATPAAHVPFLRPSDPYGVVELQGAGGDSELVPDPASYRRYDLLTDVFTSIDPQAAADVYRRVHGLVQEAFADLGYPDESFDSALATAFTTLLSTPIPATAPALERHLDTYRYVDPRLEGLQPVQKQLLRLGPDHAHRVQEQIRKLAKALDLPID